MLCGGILMQYVPEICSALAPVILPAASFWMPPIMTSGETGPMLLKILPEFTCVTAGLTAGITA